jgi:hypothetical protein
MSAINKSGNVGNAQAQDGASRAYSRARIEVL